MASSSTHVLRLPVEATTGLIKERAPSKRGDYSVRRRALVQGFVQQKPTASSFSEAILRCGKKPRVLSSTAIGIAEIPPPRPFPKAVPTGARVSQSSGRRAVWAGIKPFIRREIQGSGACPLRLSAETITDGALLRNRACGITFEVGWDHVVRFHLQYLGSDDNLRGSECVDQAYRLPPRA